MSLLVFVGTLASAQGPGTEPPAKVFSTPQDGDDPESSTGIPIRAFMFQSEAKSSVVMPEMTWEELDRLQSLEAGSQLPSQSFSYQDLDIVGTVANRRAELEVTLGLSIESTNNKWIAIPLKMGNFHRLAPPDVTGVEEYRMTLAAGGGGYLLWVKTKNRRDVTMRMQVSARVENASTRSLEFQLPDVPSTVHLTVDQANVVGDVVERGYETVKTSEVAGGRTQFFVESTGGTFTLQWGQLERKVDDAPMLEVTSRINVTWESPQDRPRVAVQLFLNNNARTTIGEIEIRLPSGATVSGDASLGVGGKTVQFRSPVSDASGDLRRVSIPELEQKSRIDLNFSFVAPLPAGGVSSKNPLAFRVPQVTGALRHRGDITIRTNDDYRLRWAAKPWVHSVLGETADEATSGRSYLFEFDRDTFELPLWLSAKERQVRVNASSRISFRDSTATLEMLIRSNDRAADGRGPQIDMADWSLQSIEDAETGEPMDTFEGDGFPEIDIPEGSGEPPTIRVLAQHSFDPKQSLVKIELPRIVKTEGGLLVPTSTLDVVSSGRTFFLVDLEASERLERVATSTGDGSESTVNRFQVHSHKTPAVLSGTIDPQPPRITLATDGSILLDGKQLHTTIDWDVTSQLDLEGVLPVRIPRGGQGGPVAGTSDPSAGGGLLENAINLFAGDPLDTPMLATDGWTVTVNGTSARLNPIDEDRFNLVSPQLGDGKIAISWRRTQQLGLDSIGESIESVAMPRPAIDDVTLTDVIRISLKGNHQTELSSALSPSVNELVLDSLPPEPIRLRLRSRETPREELSVSQAVLRSAIGRKTRHEQILAVVQGGESFKVDLPTGLSDVTVEAYIDQISEPVLRDGDTLILSLRGDQSSHVVDLRVYAPEPAQSSVERIEPLLRLPVGVGRVYWQIISPWDSHVLWASPTMGRSMTWNFSDWRLGRDASHDDPALTQMVGAAPHEMPPGNRYLYIGSDVRSFQVVAVSRVVLWMIVGSIVLLSAVALINFPRTRHPLSAVVAAVLFAGLLAVAPDTAVLAGQLGIIALALVIVMIAVRALVSPASSDRIITSREARRAEASTRSLQQPAAPERRSSVTQTQALPPSPTEASS